MAVLAVRGEDATSESPTAFFCTGRCSGLNKRWIKAHDRLIALTMRNRDLDKLLAYTMRLPSLAST